MLKKNLCLLLVLLTLVALLLSGCATTEEAAPTDAEEMAQEASEEAPVALQITGMVTNAMAWTEAEVKAMETMTVQSTNKDGQLSDYTGVSLNALLALAGVSADASSVVFLADDGSTAEVTLAELQACSDCIVSFRNQGGFSTVLPGFPNNLQVKGVIEIQIQ